MAQGIRFTGLIKFKAMTEQDRKEIQDKYKSETGKLVINSQGEFDIYYVAWLEGLVKEADSLRTVGNRMELLNKSESKEIANDFENELFKLINFYAKNGLKKPDLVHKIEYVTKSCVLS